MASKHCLKDKSQEMVSTNGFKKWSQRMVAGNGFEKWFKEIVSVSIYGLKKWSQNKVSKNGLNKWSQQMISKSSPRIKNWRQLRSQNMVSKNSLKRNNTGSAEMAEKPRRTRNLFRSDPESIQNRTRVDPRPPRSDLGTPWGTPSGESSKMLFLKKKMVPKGPLLESILHRFIV